MRLKTLKPFLFIALFAFGILFVWRNVPYWWQSYQFSNYNGHCQNRPFTEYLNFGTGLPEGSFVHGIDVSHFVCAVDWKAVKNVRYDSIRVEFAFMRATMGNNGHDFLFEKNWADCKSQGIIRGAYHYFYPWQDARSQANFFLKTVELEAGDLPPVLDIETAKGVSTAELVKGIQTWLTVVEEKTGVRPIIYTNLYHLEHYFEDRFSSYPIWIACYDRDSFHFPDNRQWLFWQHSNKATITGAREAVDLNVFNGTLEDLKSICIQR